MSDRSPKVPSSRLETRERRDFFTRRRQRALLSGVVSDRASVADLVEWAFRRHQAEIYHYLRRKTGTHDRAEELTQEVFADAAAALSRFELDPDLVLPLLYTIARRRLADDARRWARRGEISLEVVSIEPVAPPEYGPAVARAISRATLRLSHEHREILVMRLLEGRSFAEIAERLVLSGGACKMRLQRALRRLREELEREGVEP